MVMAAYLTCQLLLAGEVAGRHGIIDSMRGYSYPLVGGDPALDFLNTIHDWTAAERRDYLTNYADALRFGEASGLLSPAEVRRLQGAADRGNAPASRPQVAHGAHISRGRGIALAAPRGS